MFREFIKMDKASRKMAGEISEPGSRAIEIVVRQDHIVEDGFWQLNSLGIHPCIICQRMWSS